MNKETEEWTKSACDAFIVTRNPDMEFTITWRIENLSGLVREIGSPIYEPLVGLKLRSSVSIERNLLHVRLTRTSNTHQTIGYRFNLSLLTTESKVCRWWSSSGDFNPDMNTASVYFRFFGSPFSELSFKSLSKYFFLQDNTLIVKWLVIISCFAIESKVIKMEQTFDYRSDLINDLKRLLEEGLLTDLTLRVGDESMRVHKSILCCRSPVFAKMFQTDMRENGENLVTFSDIQFSVLKKLVDYVYSGDVEGLSAEIAEDLYRAADKYAILGLREKCARVLHENITADNLAVVYSLADMHNDEMLKSFAKAYFLQYNTVVTTTESWKMMIENQPKLATQLLSL